MHAFHRGRRLILPSFAVLALAAITCRSTAYFNLDHLGAIEVPAGAQAEPWAPQSLANINLTAHPLMRTQGLNVNDVTLATLQRATLSVESPTTGTDLSFLSSVDVVLTADNMQPVTVATATAFPPNTQLVPLTLATAQVTGYLKGKNPTFTVMPTFAAQPPERLTLALRLITQVRVGEPGGSCQN